MKFERIWAMPSADTLAGQAEDAADAAQDR